MQEENSIISGRGKFLKYKLINGSDNNYKSPAKTIFKNRHVDPKKYANLSSDCEIPYDELENIEDAVECLSKHFKDEIHVIVDCDVDGYTSSAILISYLRQLAPSINISYHIHSKKQHGFTDDINIPDTAKLIIVPDAGTNDVEACKKYSDNGTDIIILDHHKVENDNPYAIIVNNQACEYSNKNLSGVGITYKFLQALDTEFWLDRSSYFLDLVALGNIADDMDIREYETKYLIEHGLSAIQNKLFIAYCEKNSFSIKDSIPTIADCQFYIAPYINAVIRAGSMEEKKLLFKALLEEDEWFDYKKRGSTETVKESIYERAVRLSVNTKSRQNKMRDAGQEKAEKFVEKYCINDKVLFVNVSDIVSEAYTGLTAIRIATKYNRPCLILRRKSDDPDVFGGSGRNIENGAIPNLNQFLSELNLFTSILGHENAFGVEIAKANIPVAIHACNQKLKDVEIEKFYECDFIIPYSDFEVAFIHSLYGMRRFWGKGFKEPYVAVSNVPISTSSIQIIGKQSNTWKYFDENSGIEWIKFSCVDDPIFSVLNDSFANEKEFVINAVGKVSFNIYKGIATPQFIIEEYEVV